MGALDHHHQELADEPGRWILRDSSLNHVQLREVISQHLGFLSGHFKWDWTTIMLAKRYNTISCFACV